MFMCLFGVIGVPFQEIITWVMINNITLSSAVIVNTLSEFEESIKREENRFSAELICKFRDITVKIMDFDSFVSTFVDTYYWKYFLQPLFLMYSIIFSIYLYILVSS